MKKENETDTPNAGPIEPAAGARPEKTKQKGRFRENLEAIALAVLLALFIRTFVFQAFKIPSKSMLETLQVGDHILVNKFIYGVKIPFTDQTLIPISRPGRGDIIVFKFPLDPSIDYIKRVMAVAGDKIEIRNKKVYVNDLPVPDEAAIHTSSLFLPRRDRMAPVVIPKNSVFVMGDNRENSQDSRYWGVVDISMVKGKAFVIYWSWDREKPLSSMERVRWDRLGKLLK
ncbi:Signal peptidase I [Candidatus Desulfarcum epimagneticum]|uniref:Signal peptidase I n=1 Tax=uncultured Desulfobacteraceae bacterium TaxID=218296 RepID=A0A484HEF2_9BACT|nr:Signal peptidase I [uncultured Desulfobacteraceae bacterium]